MRPQKSNTQGYALITSLILLTITTGLVLGFLGQVNTLQKIGYNDSDYSTAFYAAEAGLEKLNSDLSKLFFQTVYPTTTQITNIQGSSYQPNFSGVTYTTYSLDGGQQAHLSAALTSTATTASVDSTTGWPSTGYFTIDGEDITYSGLTATSFTGLTRAQDGTTAASHSNNARVSRSTVLTLQQGPNSGLNAQVIPFTLTVVAQGSSGTEAKLSRTIQVALIPVFQFGVFSDSDLSFFAGPNFSFGGRVHTNGNLYLAEGNGNTLTLAQKVTTALDVIRTYLANGNPIANNNSTGTVNVTQSGNGAPYRALNYSPNEGSVTGSPGSWTTNPSWNALSLTTYNGKILNGATGAKALTLPFAGPGVSPVEIIKRPASGEDPQSVIYESRLSTQASLRVLLSDSAANLPGGVGYPLNSTLTGYTVDATHPPFAVADPGDSDYVDALNAPETTNRPLIDGYIKIEMQKNDNSWQDVTMEILNWGFSGGNDVAATPNPNAILRFQRLKPAKASGSTTATDYMPMSLFDPREGRFRDTPTNGLPKMGVMSLVELDANNLGKWFAGAGAYALVSSGTSALNNSGYIFYFSDRRGNRNGSGQETGEFGFEDVVNPNNVSAGLPNNSLDTGEDFNNNSTLETYGGNSPVSPYTAYPTNTDLYSTLSGPPTTTLNGGISSATNPANGATVTVSSTSGWTAPGSFQVDSEIISYTGLTATTFTGITRGAYGTTAAGHNNNANVYGYGEHYTTTTANGVTALTIAVTSNTNPTVGGIITVGSTAAFPPAPASIQIGGEIITYSAKTATTFTVSGRGAYGSPAAGHAVCASPCVSEPTIATNHPASGEWMGVSSTVGWGTSGYLLSDTEYITYSNKTANAVQVQTRGAFYAAGNGHDAAAHANGSVVKSFTQPQKNKVWYFRRALRVINGSAPNLATPGFTVASENPVYVQGDYNASGNFNGSHSYAAVIADAFTFLSNKWNDIESFEYPYVVGSRTASTTWYRMAIAAGKGINFNQLGPAQDYGTDGGTHNFLRYIENWGGQTLNYLGSIVSLYYNRQGIGTYKCCTVVYSPPNRAYTFDTDFLIPSQLPPGTPRFRDINNLSFKQTILANQ
jgi:Tfp pilus assembly protein PilX